MILVHGLKSSPALWRDFEDLIAADDDLAFVTPLGTPIRYIHRPVSSCWRS
ncbi:hypothetical protein ACFXKR_41005 [Streptomyces violascens]|uniref:hypothetical protein n=1 Tax=Streptomyces violascens TaxID=67381 RepID=UPI0036A38A75